MLSNIKLKLAEEASSEWLKALERAVKAEKALEEACDFVADITGSCPFDHGSVCSKSEDCDDNAGECFKEYFLELASKEKEQA